MLKERLEQLFEYVAKHIPSEQIMTAKKEYQKATGEIYEDDNSYNTRMALFLEWYLLDQYNPNTKKTNLENIISGNPSAWDESRMKIYTDISKNINSLFEVKKIRQYSVAVLDLFAGKKYQVDEEDSILAFRKNDIFQGRIVPHGDKFYFTGNFCFHPKKTEGYIKNEIKIICQIQSTWNTELKKLEKNLLKTQNSRSKNTNPIEKTKARIKQLDTGAKRDVLIKELSILEQDLAEIDANIRLIESEISHIKIEKISGF